MEMMSSRSRATVRKDTEKNSVEEEGLQGTMHPPPAGQVQQSSAPPQPPSPKAGAAQLWTPYLSVMVHPVHFPPPHNLPNLLSSSVFAFVVELG